MLFEFELFAILFIFLSTVESDILSKRKIETIGHWLKESNKLGTYKLCWKWKYSIANFKKSSSSVRSECERKKNTIVVLEFDFGLFGGFTDVAWLGESFKESFNESFKKYFLFTSSYYNSKCLVFSRENAKKNQIKFVSNL